MKCSYCGSRLKKSDEICPNCSKYVSDNHIEIEVHETEITPTETEQPKPACSETDIIFDYKNHILETLLLRLGIGLFLAIVLIFSAFDNAYFSSDDASSIIFAIVFSGISVFSGVATYIQEKKCIITVTDEKVFGTIPKGILETTDFEVEISDIVCVEKEGFHGKHSTPKIIIVTAENRIEIKSSSTKILERFKNTLQERIVENETRI